MKHYMFNHINTRCTLSVGMPWIKMARVIFMFAASLIFSCSNEANPEFKTGDGRITLTLPDSSRVTLNKETRILYSRFDEGHREITIEGEGYFEVRHDPRQKFVARCNGVDITVLGTAFNVKLLPTGKVSVTVTEGKVKVSDARRNFGEVRPSEQIIVDPENHRAYVPPVVDMYKTLAWRYDEPMTVSRGIAGTISALESRYHTRIVLDNKALHECDSPIGFTADPGFGMDVKDILETIARTFHATLERNDDGYVIRGGRCPK